MKGNINVQTENIFPVIKKFLYSDHEIFLRELVSNATDATQKLNALVSMGKANVELGDLTIHIKIEDGKLIISDRGIGMSQAEVEKYINQINEFYDNISVEEYVIMPDHIHLLLWVKEDVGNNCERTGTPVHTNVARANNGCSKIISTFKRFCNKEYGENIWQDRFFDHIIRNHDDYLKHVEYIHENPIKWYYEKKQSEE